MSEIGIRELKAQASRVLDEVREHGARYVITKRGRPVGVLLPLEDAPSPESVGGGAPSAWSELERLGEEIARGWSSPKSSGDVLSDLRR